MAEDMRSLEERMALLESALAKATGELQRVHGGYRRLVRANRLGGIALAVSLATVLLGGARGGVSSSMQQPQPLTVRAPFKVVDDGGRPVVTVEGGEERGLSVFTGDVKIGFLGYEGAKAGLQLWDKAGGLVAELGATPSNLGSSGLHVYNAAEEEVAAVMLSHDQGGLIVAANQSKSEQVQLRVNDDAAGFMYIKAGKPVINLGRAEKGNLALRVRANDQIVAGIGDAADGSGGALLLREPTGALAVNAAIASGQGGQVVVYGTGGGQAGIASKGSVGSAFAGPVDAPVAKMGQSETTAGAGALDLEAPGGGSAVQAGFSQGGGIVETYTPGKPVGILKAGIKIPGFTAGSNQ